MTNANENSSPLLVEILGEFRAVRHELREIRSRQDELMKSQEAAGADRRRIFRLIQQAKQAANHRPRIDYGAIADFRARGSRLRA